MTILFETRPGVKFLITDEVNINLELIWETTVWPNFQGDMESMRINSLHHPTDLLISYRHSRGSGMYSNVYKDYNSHSPIAVVGVLANSLSSIIKFLDLVHIRTLKWYLLYNDPKEIPDDWQPKAPRNPCL